MKLGRRLVDLQAGTVAGPDGQVTLTDHERALLGVLAESAGQTVPTQALQEQVWGLPAEAPSRVVRIAAWRLRKKIEEDPGQPVHLLTDHGVGLRLVVEQEEERALGDRLALADGSVDLRTGWVERRGGASTLSSQELELVSYLAANAHRQVPRQELLTEVLGYAPDTRSRALDSAVARLRQKLELDASHPEHLLTVHGVGYRWVEAAATAPAEELVGREALLAELRQLLSSARVLTLYGAGGVGKTALARVLTTGPWVDLTEVSSRGGVLGTLAAGLGLELGGEEPELQLARALRNRSEVVVLDGATRAAAHLRELLPAGPTWVVTARSPIGHADEHAVAIPELAAPDGAALLATCAKRLGPAHASWSDPGALRQLAEALEGLPLALLLAAGRAVALSVSDLLERLGTPGVLARQSGPERHRSLEAAIDWSYSLLSAQERQALEALSTCAGFELAAAETLLGQDAIDRLQRLCELQLVRREGGRYRLPRRVQEFAAARRGPTLAADHARYYAAELERRTAGLGLDVTDPQWALAELGNLRQAFREHPDRAVAARVAVALARLRGFAALPDAPALLEQAIDEAEAAGEASLASVARSVQSRLVGPVQARKLLAVPAPDPWSKALQDMFGAARGPDVWPDEERSARGLARMEAIGHPHGVLDARLIHLNSLLSHQHNEEAALHLDVGVLEARELGDERGLAILLAFRGGGMPELDALLHDYDTAIPMLERIGDQNGALRVRMLRARTLGRLHLPYEPFGQLYERIEATGLKALMRRARVEQALIELAHGSAELARTCAERTAHGLRYPDGCDEMEPLIHLVEGSPRKALKVLEHARLPYEAPYWRLLARFELGEPIYTGCLEHLDALDRPPTFDLEAHRAPFLRAVTHALAAQQAPDDEARRSHLQAAAEHGAGIPRWEDQAALWGGDRSGSPGSPEAWVLQRS